jgi:hypothetical protein
MARVCDLVLMLALRRPDIGERFRPSRTLAATYLYRFSAP